MTSKSPTKDTIYIDVDDEITSIIDKLTGSEHKIVALVLPKRATALQSIVNMKLLKRASDQHKKNLVLVTSEHSLLPLAGAVGLHVAATPNSKPHIPKKPDGSDDNDTIDENESNDDDFNTAAAAAAPIGVLAGAKALDDDDTIQLDNQPEEPTAPASKASKKSAKAAKGKKNSKLKVPNFNTFRKKLIIGIIAAIALIIFLILAIFVWPSATIVLQTESEDINNTLDVTFDTTADTADVEELVVPAEVAQVQKTTTQTANATGEKNNGQKATGQISLANCTDNSVVIPAGTGVSAGSSTFITQQSLSLDEGNFNSSGRCRENGGHVRSVNVTAVNPGAAHNVSDADFTVAGFSSIDGSGSTSGGTDQIIKTLTQTDIDGAKQKLSAQTDDTVKTELAGKLEGDDMFVVEDSFNAGNPEVTESAKAGDQVQTVTVTQKTTYSMVAAKKADLNKLIESAANDEIDTDKQRVLDTGLDEAVFKLQSQENNSQTVLMSMDVTSLAGPKLDEQKIVREVGGKKAGAARDILKTYPGVTDVEVKLSPFWVTTIPKSADKITITYEK